MITQVDIDVLSARASTTRCVPWRHALSSRKSFLFEKPNEAHNINLDVGEPPENEQEVDGFENPRYYHNWYKVRRVAR